MGRDKNEGVSQNKSKPRKEKKASKWANRFITLHPTKDQVTYLRNDELEMVDVFAWLALRLEDGCKLTCGHKPENGAFYATLRDGSVAWNESVSLSAWHTDLEKALLTLGYLGQLRYPEFPHMGETADTLEEYW